MTIKYYILVLILLNSYCAYLLFEFIFVSTWKIYVCNNYYEAEFL